MCENRTLNEVMTRMEGEKKKKKRTLKSVVILVIACHRIGKGCEGLAGSVQLQVPKVFSN